MAGPRVTRYGRFVPKGQAGPVRYGQLEGDTVFALAGAPYETTTRTGEAFAARAVSWRCPVVPSKILAVGRNYRSHLGTRPAPKQPELFYKPVSALQDPEGPIVLPPGATDVHAEGELVLVIGARGCRVSVAQAPALILGVTCGNDVSERQWQAGPEKDLQWWRAKGSDTFAPCGPLIACGLDYEKLRLATRLDGQTIQDQSTTDLLFDCATIVSFISQYVTLEPGDLVYTGTPGNTQAMAAGAVVEVEIQGIGTLRNPVVAG